MQSFPGASWNYAWYSGGPLLQYYPPLFYYLLNMFNDLFFGSVILCFLSIVITTSGIFFLLNYYIKNILNSLISSLFFLTVLANSYYFIAVGNYPFMFSLWTIPISMLLLEYSFSKPKYSLLLAPIIAISILSHIFTGLCVIFILSLRILFVNSNIYNKLIYIIKFVIPGILISSCWLIPFLLKSSSYIAKEMNYIPSFISFLGVNETFRWGHYGGSIGVLFSLFLCIIFVYAYRFKLLRKDKILNFLIAAGIISLFLLSGGLGKFYPAGIESARFIFLLAVIICISLGIMLNKFNHIKYLKIIVILILILGLIWSYQAIRDNNNNYSHEYWDSNFGVFWDNFENNNLSMNNNFNNYRFAAVGYSAKAMNFFYPGQSQISGYYDQGIVFQNYTFYFIDSIWGSSDLNSTLYYLDWFGVSHIEVNNDSLADKKFESANLLFKKVNSIDFFDSTKNIYEYLNKKSIISYSNNIAELNYLFERENPDLVIVYLNGSEKGKVIFKEFYHSSWKARDIISKKEIPIEIIGPGMMSATPDYYSKGIEFYQSYNIFNYIGRILSLIGLVLLLYIVFHSTKDIHS
ncbi:hypothetical protein FJZ22_01630 [Candidatus Pacearchaeota archaeon]|nr:hypothetical protein [Candidatus Pacearchaeota archaeon]